MKNITECLGGIRIADHDPKIFRRVLNSLDSTSRPDAVGSYPKTSGPGDSTLFLPGTEKRFLSFISQWLSGNLVYQE